MMDNQILEAQINGLTAKLKELRDHEALFNRAAGLDEAAETARRDLEAAERSIAAVKKDLVDLQARKSQSLKTTTEALSAKMSEVLPTGKGIFEIGDDGLFIGWEKPDGVRVPHLGLSGGEKNAFDQALSNALMGVGEKIICLEAAESDLEHLEALLDHLEKHSAPDCQVIVCAWQRPREIGNGWHVVEVGI